ncbi:aspartyl-phosphate phosphatase Spo0E family protein [Jeotgalibacillus haloalkalitolerans]|uniref:Aspartyl-phosphate phosphatase Spo0E family protein n=1 Tax=Jeotgalibacillus haloalkalitolerans TaxID=3104292 RepID=A0ABU5KN17_9BACL|nr:aspartyl-phosphate phosphatase Spo0E family protein [Jeotgalibacillus sp. HH7-29]MDZ5712647.1 aspartyl-phosphate phosphatase Spo0E family protein [Jeotgalibacillus sp. HH7-29]
MNKTESELESTILCKREAMVKSGLSNGLLHSETLRLSMELDQLIYESQKRKQRSN